MGSIFGRHIRVNLFGQSHSPSIGVVMDGLPAGFRPDLEALQAFVNRRSPGQHPLASQRQEADRVRVLSGLVGGKLCGAPFCAVIDNTDARSQDYAETSHLPRPGHADYPAAVRFHGAHDWAGGGHYSGRLTAALCVAGGLCLQMLHARGIRIGAHIVQIAGVRDAQFDPMAPQLEKVREGFLSTLDAQAAELMLAEIEAARLAGDSVGGVVECAALGLPPGLGDPVFDGLENGIARAVFGIPGVRGIQFGAGFAAAGMRGSQHNDAFEYREGAVHTHSNRHGGVLGGMASGMPLLFSVAFKPTPSIYQAQDTVDLHEQMNATLTLKGRHDPCFVPRAVPAVEAAAALALFDAMMGLEKGIEYAPE